MGARRVYDTDGDGCVTQEEFVRLYRERLYPLIHQLQPVLAGKITGMLLEFENTELLNLLESPKDLKKRVNEAIEVLNAHSKQSSKQ